MTIQDRADKYAIKKVGALNGFGAKQHIENYIQIATEQQEIDIRRAVEFLKNEVDVKEHFRYTKEWYIEQLKQAMKGDNQ